MPPSASDARGKLLRGLMEAFVLESIARGPRHGYGLLRELEELFGTAPNRNQVYPLLGRLVERGLVKPNKEPSGRTEYQLTGKGLEVLREYKLMPQEFKNRVLAFWDEGAREAAPSRTVERPAPREEPARSEEPRSALRPGIPLADPGERIYCPDAAITMRRVAGERKIGFEFSCDYGNLPECPMCSIFRTGEGLKKRFF